MNRPQPGLVLVSGGKYTTYRVMARDAVDAAVELGRLRRAVAAARRCRSSVPRASSVSPREPTSSPCSADSISRSSAGCSGYDDRVTEVLDLGAGDPGLLAPLQGAPGYLRAEVVYALTHEDARHLEDVLARRTRAEIETADRASAATVEVVSLMAPLLGWDEETAAAELGAYGSLVAAAPAGERESDDEGAAARLAEVSLLLGAP